jgi:uncharacterized ferredoxin-like protein
MIAELIGMTAVAFMGIALFVVMFGIIMSFFGKNIYFQDLKENDYEGKS